ncbi:MAG: hypothetical protein ACREBE_22815 [bacterium]
MGSFYTNVTVRTADQDSVVAYLTERGRRAFVSRPDGDALVVFDRDTEAQDYAVLRDLAEDLARRFACTALAVMNHDDDVLLYALCRNGQLIDEYNSAPAYFGEGRSSDDRGGDAEHLATLFGASSRADSLAALLELEAGTPGGVVFESQRHAQLVELLGSPRCAIGTGYDYLDAEEYPEDYQAADFTRI